MAIQWIGNVTAKDTKDSIRNKIDHYSLKEEGGSLSYSGNLDGLQGFYNYFFFDASPYHVQDVLFTTYQYSRESADKAFRYLKEKYRKLYGAPEMQDIFLRTRYIEDNIVHIGEAGWSDDTLRLLIMMEWDRRFDCYNIRVTTKLKNNAKAE